MKKSSILLILFLVCASILVGFYLGRSSLFIQSSKNISSEKNAMDEDYKVQIQNIPMNPVNSILSSFLSLNSIEQIQELESRKELNSYFLVMLKILSDKKTKYETEFKNIENQIDTVLGLMYDNLIQNPQGGFNSEEFSKESFLSFMKETAFKGKADTSLDLDISEIIAENRVYCNNTSTFPTETDKKWCLAQIDFFHATSLQDCDAIDGALFPDWKNICNAYYTSTDT